MIGLGILKRLCSYRIFQLLQVVTKIFKQVPLLKIIYTWESLDAPPLLLFVPITGGDKSDEDRGGAGIEMGEAGVKEAMLWSTK